MLRISKLTDYAIIVLGQMAQDAEQTHTAAGLAIATGVAMPTVSKILKRLVKTGILKSTRGARGGYALARPPDRTSVAAVIYALEGPIALTECEGERGGCEQSPSCHARGGWEVINQAVRAALESVSLADMAATVKPTEAFISLAGLYRKNHHPLSAE
ncbi:MAG: SUF system Fe-S cluster assembly regulator [Methylococcaceae bacterium]|nr:SUF system Fe-S cluster assembly regulator [Methylococcaceae bacterium]